jgi:hypothetical protein
MKKLSERVLTVYTYWHSLYNKNHHIEESFVFKQQKNIMGGAKCISGSEAEAG